MNSKQLKKQFPEPYKEFFFCCQKIASAPHSFFWIGDFSGFYGGLTISSKIPLRFYVGLEETGSSKMEINPEFDAYFPALKSFRKIRLDEYIVKELEDILKDRFKGYKMHFMSELTLGLSLGGLGAISAAIAELCAPNESFDKKFKIAKIIVTQIQKGRTSPATAFASLHDSLYPTVYWQSGAKSWGKSLDEMIELQREPVWPFDFGLIFSGNLVQGAAVIASAEEIKQISALKQKQISKLLGDQSNSFWDDYLKMLDHISKQTLFEFGEIFRAGASDARLGKFFECLNQYQNLLHYLDISTVEIDRIYSLIHQISNKQENRVGSGCKITGVGKGGEVLFAVPFGGYREKIPQALKKLGGLTSLDYASWSGGYDRCSTLIEQDLNLGNISKIASNANSLIKVYTKNSLSTKIYNNKTIQADLVLNLISGKILFKNRSPKSSLIFSQKATVEILAKILASPERKLSNEHLGKYGKSRYDLQSKIAIPLSKLSGLKFEIRGGVYDDFSIQLKPFDLTIAVISSIE